MQNIVISGVNEIESKEKAIVDKLTKEYYTKIKRLLKNELELHIYIKKYSKSGSKPKWSINAKANAPTREFSSNKASEFDFAKTIHKALKDLENEIKHKLKL